MKPRRFFSFLKRNSINRFSRARLFKLNLRPSKKKQTFDFEGIFSKFVRKCNSAEVALLHYNNMKLSELKPGQEAIISRFERNEIYLKLMEMGCVPGERIFLEQIAPMGDPISIKIAGYSLSLRLNEAEHINVELIN
jgi:ferrous iron transport protein A